MNYGVQTTGYVRKPLSAFLAQMEAAFVSQFGPGVIQTEDSPFGMLNGMMADVMNEIDENNLDLYQSYDPDQAEGTRLNTLARIRLVSRGSLSDEALRQAITNEGQARIDIQDLTLALAGLQGVTYAQVFVNDSGEVSNPELERGFVAVAIIGGDDDEIADVVRRYVVPGVSTYGNVYLSTNVNGFCRSVAIIRPVIVPVRVEINVKVRQDRNGCPPPSRIAIEQTVLQGWIARRQNGLDVSNYQLRSIIESAYSTVEFVSFSGARENAELSATENIPIAFVEMAELEVEVTIT